MAFEGVRDWWERLAPREKRLFGLLGLTFVVCVFALIGYRIRDGLAAIEARNAAAREALRSIDEHRDDLMGGGGPKGDLAARLGGAAPSLAPYLESIANEVGIQIPESSERTPTTKGEHNELVIDVKLRGVTIDQLAQFLKKVETRHPAVVTQRLYVRTYFNQHEKLDVELTVAAYEKAQKKAPKGGGGGEAKPDQGGGG